MSDDSLEQLVLGGGCIERFDVGVGFELIRMWLGELKEVVTSGLFAVNVLF